MIWYFGYWQIQRREWKLDLINRAQTRPLEPALIGLPKDFLENQKTYEYRKLIVRGRFDHENERRIIPRSYMSCKKFNPLNSRKNEPEVAKLTVGGNIITPFILTSGDRILVNRGFVSWDYMEPETRKLGKSYFKKNGSRRYGGVTFASICL